MSNMTEKYDAFVHRMWIKNCDERQEWCMPRRTKAEYLQECGQFLEDTFWQEEYGSKLWNGEKYA